MSALSKDTIAAGDERAVFTVRPKANLAKGQHTAIVEIRKGGKTLLSIPVSFTVESSTAPDKPDPDNPDPDKPDPDKPEPEPEVPGEDDDDDDDPPSGESSGSGGAYHRSPVRSDFDGLEVPFTDLYPSHWAYYDILEAALEHKHTTK